MEQAIQGIDSVVAFSSSQGLKGRGTLVHISRSLAVFEIYNPLAVIQLSEVLAELRVMRGERIIYQGKGVVTSIVTTGLMTIITVTLTDSWLQSTEYQPGENLESELRRFITGWEEGHDLAQPYQLVVNKMSNFLSEVGRWIEETEVAILGTQQPEMERQDDLIHSLKQPVAAKVGEFFQMFESEASQVPPEELILHKTFARRELHPYVLCAPFAYRTYTKPLGYAGDYEMVNMMLRESDSVGSNTYSRILHELHIGVAAAEAHRNRIDMLVKWINEEAESAAAEERIFSVLNVGCGPAVEIQRFIRNSDASNKRMLTLMDFNKDTLEYTQKRITQSMEASGNKPTLRFIRKSIDELLKDVHNNEMNVVPTYDMVYCAGLFDYFPQNVCRNLVELYYRWVKPGGRLVVTNVHPDNPERHCMEHLLEWYLIHRDEQDMQDLVPVGAVPEITLDSTGVNIFLSIRKQS